METTERLASAHPGAVLRHDFLEPLGLTAHALSVARPRSRHASRPERRARSATAHRSGLSASGSNQTTRAGPSHATKPVAAAACLSTPNRTGFGAYRSSKVM
jgi:hypothetical protein